MYLTKKINLSSFSKSISFLILRNQNYSFGNSLRNFQISSTSLTNANNQLKPNSNAGGQSNNIITKNQLPKIYKRKSLIKNEERYILAANNTNNDPDVFGTLSSTLSTDESNANDSGDEAEEKYLKNPPDRHAKLTTKQYADIIKEHLKNKRIKEAIDVLEIRMCKEDRVKPENYIFNLLIGACGRYGYSKKAFNLYNKMKQRGLKVTGGTYTGLFNACSTSPWLQDGLNKANHLREIMIEKRYEPNASNYNAMIKAYGRCGDLQTAFQLVDEMNDKQLPIKVDTFNFLLQACATDIEFGFRHSLLVWHKMLRRRLLPDIYSFNLMLRCVRDCSVGDLSTLDQVIQDILIGSTRTNIKNSLLIETAVGGGGVGDKDDKNIVPSDQIISTTALHQEITSATPNLLSRLPHLGQLVEIHQITKPEDRLLLLGGTKGFLFEMDDAKCEPDIKTFTQLIEICPPTVAAEKMILTEIRNRWVKCDIDFFNILIKKRSMRFDYDGAKQILPMIEKADLKPDIVTYGVLALGCQTPEESDELIQEMYNKGIRINIQILGAMLRQGCSKKNFPYIIKIMDIVQMERIKPNEQFLKHLHSYTDSCYQFRKKEPYGKTKKFNTDFKQFLDKLEKWSNEMGFADLNLDEQINIVREHPWEQFKYNQPDGMEPVKNPKLRHEKKLHRVIKKVNLNRFCPTDESDEIKSIDTNIVK